MSEESFFRGCLMDLREKTKGFPVPVNRITELYIAQNNVDAMWTDHTHHPMDDLFTINPVKQNPRQERILQAARQVPQPPFNRGDFGEALEKAFAPTAPKPVPQPAPKPVSNVNRRDMEEVISKALSSAAHPPPTPPHPPVSKRPSKGVKVPPPPVSQRPSRGATALPPAPPIQVHYPGGGTVLFNIRPGQNDPALQQTSDKRAKNLIPTDLKCPKCGFQAKSYASIKKSHEPWLWAKQKNDM